MSNTTKSWYLFGGMKRKVKRVFREKFGGKRERERERERKRERERERERERC